MKHAVTASTKSLFAFFMLFAALGIVVWCPSALPAAPPTLSVMPLDLSRAPTTEEMMAAGQLGGPLHPTHILEDAAQSNAVNLSFGKAIQAWNRHDYDHAAKMFADHVDRYPDSPWAAEAVLHEGCYFFYHGRYSEAETAFEWILNRNMDRTLPGSQAMLNKANVRLGILRVAQDRLDEALDIFRELKERGHDWRHRTYASHWIQRISRYKGDRLALLNCGTEALAYLFERDGNESAAREMAAIRPAGLKGHSIEALAEIASRYGRELVAVKLAVEEIEKISVPAIVYIDRDGEGERGHYWVIERVVNGRVDLFDPPSGRRFQQTPEQFAREWSGVALVFQGRERVPGTKLGKAETERLFGGCCGVRAPADNTGQCDGHMKSGGDGTSCGAPAWSVNMTNMNIYVADTPLWYASPIGPSVHLSLSFNSLSTITYHEPFGNKWHFNYGSHLVVDPSGTVTLFMPDGRVDQYPSDGKGGYTSPYRVHNRLTRIAENHFELRMPDDTVYVYQIPASTTAMQPFLVEIRDAHQQKLTLGYNPSAQLISLTDALGRVTSFTYNSAGLVTNVSDPFGRHASFEYDGDANLVKITDMGGYWTALGYDLDVNLAGLENERGKWEFSVEAADGINNGSNHYPAPGAAMWEDYRITATDPLGNSEEYYYDGYSSYSWFVSPRDYVAYQSESVNNYQSAPKTQYKYVTVGENSEIGTVMFPGGGRVDYGYDAAGNRISVKDSHGHKTTFTYNSMGNVTSSTNPQGVVTQMIYAANDVDLLEIKNGLGSIQLTYDTAHDVVSARDRTQNPPWKFTYNAYGQPVYSRDPLGVVTEYVYNDSHQLKAIKTDRKLTDGFIYDAVGRIAVYTDATGLARRFSYNNLDNIVRVTYPDGKYEEYSYAGCCPYLVDRVTDRAGRSVRLAYDARQRLTEIHDPAGNRLTRLYDANGNPAMFVDALGNTTSFDYDLDNRLTRRTYADGRAENFGYDEDGLLISRTNARGIVTAYSYDEAHNLQTVSYSDDTPGVNYAYDAYGRPVQRLDALGSWTFTYDRDSRPLTVNGPWPNDLLTYTYDKLGRVAGRSVEGGQSTVYGYDTLSRLTGVQAGTGTYRYAYAGNGPLVQSLTRPEGSVTSYQYDALNRPTLVSHRTGSGAVIREFGYAWNAEDLIAKETIVDGNQPLSLSPEFTVYAHNEVNQAVRSVSPERTFLYDADGNMIQGYTPEGYLFRASYDAENRLESLTYKNSTGVVCLHRYYYTGNGALAEVRRYENNVLANQTRSVNEGFLPVQELDGGNAVKNQYQWGLHMGGGIGGLLQLTQAGQSYSYLNDARGNVIGLLNNSQTLAAFYSYDGYGNPTVKSGDLEQPFRYSTKPYDAKTGLHYYGYRFYSSELGRWITRDPLGEAGGVNLYGFLQNDPVNEIDLFGLASVKKFTNPVSGFSPDDLNFAVRLIYAEASNNFLDQFAVASVLWNRIGASNLSGGKQYTFYGVGTAPNQFEAIKKTKFKNSPCIDSNNWSEDAANEYNSAFDALSFLLNSISLYGTVSIALPYNFFWGGPQKGYTPLQNIPRRGNWYWADPIVVK